MFSGSLSSGHLCLIHHLKLFWPPTGSTIRNWYKVKSCLDQMFWYIYQKLMFSGFLSNGHLCLIHHLKLFWPYLASTASGRKDAKIQHEFSWFCQNIFFSKHQNKYFKSPQIIDFKNLAHSVVIFPTLKTSAA